jgi:hypothetical protein
MSVGPLFIPRSIATTRRIARICVALGGAGLISCGLLCCRKQTTDAHAAPPNSTEEVVSHASKDVLPKAITFNEHIQPILSENCYHCHGPDAGTRAPKDAPLRLDIEEEAFAPRENGKPVIIKGNPDESLLMKLIRTSDPSIKMPPPEGHKVLKERDILLIEAWIRQGAVFEDHWAFVPVKRPALPTAGDGFAVNPIDRFVAEKLEEHGMAPNEPEDPRRFHRRMAFDLTGLPPAPWDANRFVAEYAINPQRAVEDAADRFLESTYSAEHFARHWLDAARYADTHGIHIDNYRSIWPYRDWIIRSFQVNMPWDQFTTEQIAGDLVPGATLDHKIATGFNRCLATTGEGGIVDEEYDAIYAKDRTETMSAVWLGLTTGCASCHDHKSDPISTKEFYSLTAFFRNTTIATSDGNDANHPPNVFVPRDEDRPRWDQLNKEIEETNALLSAREQAMQPDFKKWLADASVSPNALADEDLVFHAPLNESSTLLLGRLNGEKREWQLSDEVPRVEGLFGPAPLVSKKTIELGDAGAFSRTDRFSFGAFIRIEGTPNGTVLSRLGSEAFSGWEVYLDNGRLSSHFFENNSAAKITAVEPLTPRKWHHILVTFDGSRENLQTTTLHVDGLLQRSEAVMVSIVDTGPRTTPLQLGMRNGNGTLLSGPVAIQDFRLYRGIPDDAKMAVISSEVAVLHILGLLADQRSEEQQQHLANYYTQRIDPVSRDLRTRLASLEREHETLKERGTLTLVMEERQDSTPFAYVLSRGQYADKGEKVGPDTPAVLPPMSPDAPKNRLGLAKWLNDPANPLPARVTMNRTWHQLFGTGIVETTDDFGIMGARPSHPKLLDWLASEFVASGWNYRHMVKLMVTSATYRQSSTITPEKLERDPGNRLLARGPRVRLDGEQLRDMALASSGLMVYSIGGPPVKPYQPDEIWEAVAAYNSNTRQYIPDQGDGLYRRSLYTFWKRTAAPPSLELFNAPSREVTCVRRDRTNTPLQALVLMNDPQFVEASRILATHALERVPGFDERLDYITSLLLNRRLAPEEREVVKATLDELLAIYRTEPEEAKKILTTGAAPPPSEKLSVHELAAWTIVSNQIFNLDEAVTR